MKKTVLLKLLTLFLAVVWAMPAFAQMSAGGTPPSFGYETGRAALGSAINLPVDFDVEAMKAADKQRELEGKPPTIAKVIPLANLTTENSGEWTTLPNGQTIWRLSIKANDALAVNLTYDKFEIPEGGRLFIYGPQRLRALGAYTSANNPKRVEYATEFLYGDELILEYAPPAGNFASPFVITGLGYGYNYITANSRYGQATDHACHIDINCPEGADWQNEKQGVARIIMLMDGGSYGMCSGTIVNNTAQNLDPLYLSAWHCFDGVTAAQLNQSIFYFKFEQETCGGTSSLASLEGVSPTITGCTMLAQNSLSGGSDGALVVLNEGAANQSEWYRNNGIYFNGWDRRDILPTSGAGIHHPAGNVKKISIYTDAPTLTGGLNFQGASAPSAANGHLNVAHVKGITEGGSSGSPVFDQNHRVVGTLSGGPASNCNNASNTSYYGRLWYHWDKPDFQDEWLKPYLDPGNTGDEFIDGVYEPGAKKALFNANPPKIYAMESVRFRDASVGASTWDWEFPGGTPESYTATSWADKNPPMIQYTVEGLYSAKLTINKGTADELVCDIPVMISVEKKTMWDVCSAGTGTATQGYPFGPTTAASDLACSLLGLSCGNTRFFTAALYEQSELSCVAGTIKGLTWKTNTAFSSANDNRSVKIWLKHVPASWTDITNANVPNYGAAMSGATLVGQYAGITNDVGDQTFIFNVEDFEYDPAYNIMVITETMFGSAGVRNPAVPYTVKTNCFKYITQAVNAAALPASTATMTMLNNRPNVSFIYDLGYAVSPVADFTMTGDPTPGTIYEGGSIVLTDVSTGPPVLWSWALDGANFSSSTLQKPSIVRYMNEGTYNVSLDIINTEGSSSITKPVSVYSRVPVPQFYGWSDGLLRYSNSGPFLSPKGGGVGFEDVSERYPKAWEWNMPGADINSSTEPEVSVTYPAGYDYYDVTLTASNSAGTAAPLVKTGFVKTGGTDEVWNMFPGETPNVRYTLDLGLGCGSSLPLTGVGSYCLLDLIILCLRSAELFTDVSERFSPNGPGEVSSVRVYTQNTGGTGNMTVAIYSDRGGAPSECLSPVMEVTPVNGGYNTITFPEPVGVSGRFHVVCGYTGTRTFTVPSVASRTNGYNTASGKLYGETWIQYGQLGVGSMLCQTGVTTPSVFTSLNIIPTFTYTETEFLSDDFYRRKDVDDTVAEILFETTGTVWNVTAIDDCFDFSANSGTITAGAGSFSFTMKDNTNPEMQQVQFKVSAGGAQQIVTVLQGGSFPENFKAEYDNRQENILVTWGTPPYMLGDEIFEDVEHRLHKDFAIDSPGYYGWSYINPEKPTYGSSVISFPGEHEPMAFIVFNPSKTTPSVESGYPPKSGSKFFASFQPEDDLLVDAWMISPELAFTGAARISFWARSLDATYTDRFKVGYSTTGKDKDDFIFVTPGAYVSTTTTWAQYTYDIPANAKYVAIQNVSVDGFALFIDDIFIGTGPVPAPSRSPETENMIDNLLKNAVRSKRTPAPAVNKLGLIPILSDVSPALSPMKQKSGKQLMFDEISNTAPARANATDNPARTPEEVTLRWDSGVNARTIGLPDGGDMRIGTYFEPLDLFGYTEITIKAVDVYLRNVGSDMELRIFQNSTLVYSQPVTSITAGGYNRITLTTPYEMDMTKDLLVAYRFIQAAGQDNYMAGADAGPAVPGKGDMVAMGDDDYMSLSENSSINCNWNIAIITDAEPLLPPTYDLYRGIAPSDTDPLAQDMEVNIYRDSDIVIGTTYCYQITATYLGDPFFTSVKSPKECVFAKSPIYVTADNKTMVESDPIPTWTRTVTGVMLSPDIIDDVIDPSTYTNIATTASPAGTYTIGIKTESLQPDKYAVKDIDGLLTITSYPNVITGQPVGASVCEGNNYTFTVDGTGLELHYQWQKYVLGSWQIIEGATGSSYTITNVTREDAGLYRVLLMGRTLVTPSEEVELIVAISPSSILVFEWKDLPSINCNASTNGGYTFVSFQWYDGNSPIPGATKPYLQVSPSKAYNCEMQLSDGRKFRLCNYTSASGMALLLAYPNPVTSGENLTVRLDNAAAGSVVNVYDMNGSIVKGNIQMQSSGATINMGGLAAGIYVIQVATPDGVKRTTQVVVK